MINITDSLKKNISQLAGVLNQFKSEAVQVQLLERFFSTTGSIVQPLISAASAAPKRRGRPPGSGAKKAAAAPKAKAKKAGRKRSKMGATGALHKLLENGFFKSHRTIADVTDACKSKLGLEIAVTNLSGPLMRFVKDKQLVRAKNKDDKFEYWAK